jgi:hypothetical protein
MESQRLQVIYHKTAAFTSEHCEVEQTQTSLLVKCSDVSVCLRAKGYGSIGPGFGFNPSAKNDYEHGASVSCAIIAAFG